MPGGHVVPSPQLKNTSVPCVRPSATYPSVRQQVYLRPHAVVLVLCEQGSPRAQLSQPVRHPLADLSQHGLERHPGGQAAPGEAQQRVKSNAEDTGIGSGEDIIVRVGLEDNAMPVSQSINNAIRQVAGEATPASSMGTGQGIGKRARGDGVRTRMCLRGLGS